ncbi:sodium-dependent proline transporter-like [Haliotis rubra]|uniref:sodium-dependent proline transporter-like n=1 Tax=Haliotis rubra TaxID=36100 RepID=UPI001EE5A16B|nr:sodium-dependent proline transporter-like [Haliotis rubra]XP_046584049.1 sodium-dependent proline transporter-like [Haliotis rubra]
MSGHRGNWSNWLEFLFSVIGSMVGLGNIWRFPYICFQSGGAAFLIPYFLAMFVCGMPAILLELMYSQYSNLGPGRVWIICPLFQGIGYGMVVLTAIISIYYNVILAWTLYYIVGSFSSVLPWSTCDNEWNTDLCHVRTDQSNSSHVPLHGNETQVNTLSELGTTNISNVLLSNMTNRTLTPSEEYWRHHVLQMSSGIEDVGSVRWQLLVCLLVAWLVVFLSLIKGIKSSGKVVYVAATVPYLILIALLVRGLLLPGAVEGIRYYAIPQWSKLLDAKVWRNGASQVFFSAGIGWGGIATLSSYNKFHNNCYRDAMVLPLLDCLTSWFAGFIIFVFLGYMANQSNLPISEVVKEGPGLAFMAYPDAVSTMPLPQLWACLFFLMLFTVGLDSQFVHVQTIVTALTDAFPAFLGHRKLLVTACVCLTGFILGLTCVTQGGIYVLTLMDWYVGSISVMVLAMSEMLVLAWVYGVNRLYDDLEMMIGYRVSPVWKAMWLVATPLFVFVLFIAGLTSMSPVALGGREFPYWAQAVGWLIAVCPLLPIPVGMVLAIWREKDGSLKERLIQATKPRKEWGPALGGKTEEGKDEMDLKTKDMLLSDALS